MAETKITGIKARKVYDSRGEEAIEVEITAGRAVGRAAAPAGKSKGGKEVAYYPPGGVEEAVRLVNSELKERLRGVDAADPKAVDDVLKEFDGTGNLERIGGNTAFAVALSSALAASNALNIPLYQHLRQVQDLALPLPLGNVIGGGKHAGRGAPDWQELLVIPLEAPDIEAAIKANIMVHRRAGRLLDKLLGGFTLGKGDEGAYAPPISTENGLKVLREAADQVSDELGLRIGIGADVAASSFWHADERTYFYETEGKKLSREEQITRVAEWVDRFQLVYVEDPLEENDLEGFAELNQAIGKKALICGDDLIVTRPELLKGAAERGAVGAVIIKPNQVGLLTTAMETSQIAHQNKITPVVSHRSGEPPEGHLSHLAVAWGAKIIKAGIVGGERIAKANELIRISEKIGGRIHTLIH